MHAVFFRIWSPVIAEQHVSVRLHLARDVPDDVGVLDGVEVVVRLQPDPPAGELF